MNLCQFVLIASVCVSLTPRVGADIFDTELIAFLADKVLHKLKDGWSRVAEFKPTAGRSDDIDRDLIRHHFDSVHFCEDFTVGHEMKEPVIKSFTTMKKTAYQDLDVIRCVAAVEVMALPHNIVQDFRWTFTEVRRQSRSFGILKHIFMLPFALIQTLALLPFRIFREFLKLSFLFFKAHRSIYFDYI